ncbi:uracil-DNA glycosylase [Natrialba magadii ATCC 43099]|uniref:Type-4 uracil-DNA glycosylase n=1 Tax=Natrialba magadii (strain ATCC 43099 / DSM 3394 / CCM 3739 / CIP 104546 / IAM 13178 / JCM 8861 / NBRC 102185 / NCIMB 2190 / MS3) TaxID=547559 RepID=D3STK9_NATMM|nr:uracil-DNA glycosylase [Natrialba magadii]ADD05026.1 uracil-DNA glycosylase [Natrialba magadii ATCC 43099]ELY23400.1 phage SPO1 DNA polymerase-like protein [Natrialba magadii ATCC 43099]
MGEMEDLCVTECERCPALVDSRSQIVNGTGPEDADILFVGEGPGAQEDSQGEPFVGRSGSVLDDQLRIVGLDRDTVRITNCVRCRPPENRDPTTDELENCRSYLEQEIELLDPDVIVTLGKVPTEHLLDRDVAVTKEAGSVEDVRVNGTPRRLLICVHPAATLYDRSQEETFESALERAAELAGVDGSENTSGQTRLDGF